jgi:hypothetical protein
MFKLIFLSAVGICYGLGTAKKRGLQPFSTGSNYGTMAINTVGSDVHHKRSLDDAGNRSEHSKRVEDTNDNNVQLP